MFKLAYIMLVYTDKTIKPTTYEFKESTYVYGDNNKGKTVLVLSIDYVLGKSQFVLGENEGLDGIEYIEAKLEVDSDVLYLRRTNDNIFSYKTAEADEYIVTSDKIYKDQLTYLINKGDTKYLKIFTDFAEENLTSRAFTLFNFVDEKGLGNLTNIFTRAKEDAHSSRVRNLMQFIFNFDNIQKLCELTAREQELIEYINEHSDEKAQYNYLISQIQTGFSALQIDFPTVIDIAAIKATFLAFKTTFSRDARKHMKSEGDLGYLIRISHSLSEEIKYQRNLENQSKKITSRNERAKKLLSAFKELAENDAIYSHYVEEIESLIKKQTDRNNVFAVIDYGKTIETIEKKKADIDEQITTCSVGLSKNEYEDTMKAIGVLEQAFNAIEKHDMAANIEQKESELREVRDEMKRLKMIFSDTLRREFNATILSYYKELDNQVQFAIEDFKKVGFGMNFSPLKCSLSGMRAKNEQDSKEMLYYNPGSMARETTWQVLAYLTMFKILLDKFPELPFLRILIIDGLNQPFDETVASYPPVYKFIQKKAKELGIQLLVISTFEGDSIGAAYQIDLNNGFNKAHKI